MVALIASRLPQLPLVCIEGSDSKPLINNHRTVTTLEKVSNGNEDHEDSLLLK